MSTVPSRPRQFAMRPRNTQAFGEVHSKYQNVMVEIVGTLNDPTYGAGIYGYNMFNGELVAVFSNPVESERKKKYAMGKSMSDWVRGLNINRMIYTLGPGAIALVNDITIKGSFRAVQVMVNGQPQEAKVLFCQWISCWRSSEAAAAQDNSKSVHIGYGIGVLGNMRQDGEGDERSSFARVLFFQPAGPYNRYNEPNAPYPVVFSASGHNLDELLLLVDHETNVRKFTSWMVRMVEKESGLIIGEGETIRMYRRDPNIPYSEQFARNLALRLGLTRSGLASLVANDKYEMQVFGLHEFPCSFVGREDGRESVSMKFEANPVFFPRDETGNLVAVVAAPIALRGSINANGGFWLDKIQSIGHIGVQDGSGQFAGDSEVIAADAYSGMPVPDDKGENNERGLDRVYLEFVFKTDDGQEIVESADSIRSLARLTCCQTINYPGNRVNFDYFDANWNDMPDVAFPVSEAGVQAAQALAQTADTTAAQAQPVQPARQAQPAQPARRPQYQQPRQAQPAQQPQSQPVQQPQARPAAQPAAGQQFVRPGNYGSHYSAAQPRQPEPEVPADPVYPSEQYEDEVPF